MAGRKSGHTCRTNRGAKALTFGTQDGLVWLRLCLLLSIESPYCAVVPCQRRHSDVCRMHQYSMHSALAPAPPSPGQNEYIFIIYRTHTARGAKFISTGTSTMNTVNANRETMQCAIACSAIGEPQLIFFSMHVSNDGPPNADVRNNCRDSAIAPATLIPVVGDQKTVMNSIWRSFSLFHTVSCAMPVFDMCGLSEFCNFLH